MMGVDYEDMLRRYIVHVRDSEGVDFIDGLNDHTRSEVQFTPDEVAEMERLRDEDPVHHAT